MSESAPADSLLAPENSSVKLPEPKSARQWIEGLITLGLVLAVTAGSWWVYRSVMRSPHQATASEVDLQAPSIHLAEMVLDLGDVALDEGDIMPVAFPYQNRGQAPLTIIQIASTCSCTSATASRKVTPPGEFGKINVLIQRSTLGPGSAMLLVDTDDPVNKRLELKCQWNGIARLQFDQTTLHFGDVLPGAIVKRELTLMFKDQQRFPKCAVARFEASPELKVAPLGGKSLNQPLPKESKFEVTLEARRELGEGGGRIRCFFEDCYKEEFAIPVSWNVRSRIHATPHRLFLESGAPGDTLKKRLIVTATSPDRLVIKSAKLMPDGSGSVTLRKISDICQEVEVRVPLTRESKLLQGTVLLECLEPTKETLEIPWSGILLPTKQSGVTKAE